ncbi:hypothetical protein OIU35_20320 [Boseaceae bacterium BT-24-1]|nr:hypothetical protein [Boseaceae bacterium BT-24-1]
MADMYFSVNIDNDRTLCLAPLTERKIIASGQDIADTSGYFLFERRGSGDFATVEIIAQVISDDAVFRIREMLNMS